jgi:carboxypeptidase Taq
MTTEEAYQRLLAIVQEVNDLERAAAVLGWDQQVNMPMRGNRARAEQIGTLRRLAHARLTSPETGELLDRLAAADLPPDGLEAGVVVATRRVYERERRVPERLVTAVELAAGEAFEAWLAARRERRWAVFAPAFERLLGLVVEVADAVAAGAPDQDLAHRRYDSLLYLSEPGVTTARLEAVFATLKSALVPLVQAIQAKGGEDRERLLHGDFPEDRQEALLRRAVTAIGFDLERGRIDRSVHPFETSFDVDDVRITVRYDRNHFGRAFFAALHEAGHGLYEQGLPRAARRTPLGRAISSGVHESQSRLWENLVGRSEGFWRHFLPVVREAFPAAFGEASLDAMVRAVNAARPSLIRVEADEVTYNLHIVVRFEIELGLLAGDLTVADVPAAWREKMAAYLGVTPTDDLEGALQDIHWSSGGIAAFPSYTIGNVIAAALFAAAKADVPQLEEGFARGEFAPLLDWLRTHLHSLGARYDTEAMLERVTGRGLDPEPYVRYIRDKFSALYDLDR